MFGFAYSFIYVIYEELISVTIHFARVICSFVFRTKENTKFCC